MDRVCALAPVGFFFFLPISPSRVFEHLALAGDALLSVSRPMTRMDAPGSKVAAWGAAGRATRLLLVETGR